MVDGSLYSAQILNDGELEIDSIQYAPVRFEYKSNNYTRGSYSVDVVRLQFLESYVDILSSINEAVHKEIENGMA